MKLSDKYLKILLVAVTLLFTASGYAVTQKEMEQARTIAAKAYLRYANDGSGYLDDLNPTTMEELESQLKTKEKENIKAFKAIPVPSDYSNWDREKLLEYWAVTAFQDKGLLEKGRGGRIRARTQINKMPISAPQPTAPAPASELSVKNESSKEAKDTTAATLADLTQEEEALAAPVTLEDPELNVEKATNYTWVYIMALAILVAIVIALVVYASNVLKRNGANNSNPYPRGGEQEDHSEAIERYEALIADKDVEIAMANKKLESANRINNELKAQIEKLTSELNELKNRAPVMAPAPVRERTQENTSSTNKPRLRSIYLGRANSRGIFVRADRTLNVGNSVFILETSDGYTGSFKVADSPAAWSLALSNPKEYLETACTGSDLDDTASASRIVTENSGTAVFEGGCWRVIRKAKIRYE